MTTQNANIIDVIQSLENYKLTMGRKEVEIDAAKPFLVMLANAALNTAISGFNYALTIKEAMLANKERTAEALAELTDEERRTEMQQYLDQETFLETLMRETTCAARLYNHLAADFVGEKDQYSRPMGIQQMIAFRAGLAPSNQQDQFIKEKAAVLGMSFEEAKVLTRPHEIRVALDFCKRAPDIASMILDAGEYDDVTIGTIEIPLLHQLSWAKKLVDKALANADKRIGNSYNRETIARAQAAKEFTLQHCKQLEEFSNRLIDENAQELLDLESRGRIIPIVDIEGATETARESILARAKSQAAELQKQLDDTRSTLAA